VVITATTPLNGLSAPLPKQSELDAIPNDWQVRQIGELGQVVRGSSPRPAGDPRYFDGSFIPWLTVAELTNLPDNSLYVSETFEYLTEEGAKHSRHLSPGILIIANSGATLGVAKVLGIECCANDGIAAILNQRSCDAAFLCYYLNTQTNHLREVVATGNGQPNLNTVLIRAISIPIPPRSEQLVIAEALSDVDGLLGALDALIAKKSAIKRAAMQQLLTGKIRLPGFGGEWGRMQLGQVVEIRKGQLITTRTKKSGDIPVIAGGKQPAYYHSVANRQGRTITISASGASAGYVAFHDTPIFASDCSTISEGDKYSLDFIFYQLVLKQELIYRRQTGGAQPHIHPADVMPIDFDVPRLEEQAAIARVLSDMDAEIAALEARHEKTRAIKQGMMQQLLTGRVRLVKPAPAGVGA
jgi:type I restriction enzyme S subunit